MLITPEQIRAARALLRLDQSVLARDAGISIITLRRLEDRHGLSKVAPATVDSVRRVLGKAGAEFMRGNRWVPCCDGWIWKSSLMMRASLVQHERRFRFGKSRHPAGLHFGDCATYALAHTNKLPLLFKGEDFSKTDLIAAVPAR